MENIIEEYFDNVNPDEGNKTLDEKSTGALTDTATVSNSNDLATVYADRNGQVIFAEAKAAGYKMPITTEDRLYQRTASEIIWRFNSQWRLEWRLNKIHLTG